MRIEYPDIYMGKRLRIRCIDGQEFVGELDGWNFDYDDNGNKFSEIDMGIIGFTEMEIESIEILGDAR